MNRKEQSVRYVVLVLTVLLTLLTSTAGVFADPQSPSGVFGTHDDLRLEFGVWWVEDYPPAGSGGSDLPNTRPDALGLRDYLTSDCRTHFLWWCVSQWPTPRWTARFVYGNRHAWEQDWKRTDRGGTNQAYVDSVDLAYFAGHGSSTAFYFGVGGNRHDDGSLTYDDALQAWGNRDLDWVALAACNVLEDSHRTNWANTFWGLRLLMGFVTTMADVPHGKKFGKYIRLNYSMTQAWFRAADDLQPQGKIARVLAEETWMFNDKWYNHRSTDYYDNWYHWITHHVGSEPARYVNAEQFEQMPVFMVQPLSLDEANTRWDTLVAATGITETGYITETSPLLSYRGQTVLAAGRVRMTKDGQLIMDEQNGLYNYVNARDLWVVPTQSPSRSEAVQVITQQDARQIADQFLTQNGLMPEDASFYEVVEETLSSVGRSSQGRVGAAEQTQVMAHQVIYSRHVTATFASRVGARAQAVTFSVMGPGSKLKVYVAPQVPASLRGERLLQEAVDGVVGGYRRVQPAGLGRGSGILTIPIISVDQAKQFVLYKGPNGQPELETMFGLSAIPLPDIEKRTIVTNTLAYWEGPMGWSQDQLIPVHVFEIRNVLRDQTVVTSTAYIPANPQFMPPLAKITRVETAQGAPIPERVMVGDRLVFEAFDASLPLAEAGYPQNLNFVAGSGDVIYNWYVDEVKPEKRVGTGRVLHYVVAPPTGDILNGAMAQTIILEVVDIGTNRQPDRSYTRYTFTVTPPLFMPTVLIR